jgi:hypothetical protein
LKLKREDEMRLRVRALGVAGGIVWGGYIFFATLWLIWFREGAILPMFVNLYPGYASTYVGACIGFLWGFVDGFFCGALMAWLYNRFQKSFYKTEVH